jgi:predicted nucleic acid-binding protein
VGEVGLSNDRVCFDSSIWNAILNAEEDKDLVSIQGWIKKIEAKNATLLVPAIVVTELWTHPDEEKVKLFEAFLLRDNVSRLDITNEIAKNAGRLRRLVVQDKEKLKTPDALIVVAADYHHATYILSVDKHILRCNGKYGLKATIGLPSLGHNQGLLDYANENPS